MNKGYLTTFEGPDFSGKTANSIELAQKLQQRGHEVILLREPGGTRVGDEIRAILHNPELKIDGLTELFLFEAARNQICTEIIRPSLREGKVVVLDRFTDSTLAYQGWGRGIDISLIHQLNQIVTGGLVPNLTFFLDVNYEVGLVRVNQRQKDRFDLQGKEFFERVREGYSLLTLNDLTRRWIRIDTNQLTFEEVSTRVLELTLLRLTEAGIEPRREVELFGKERR